MGQRACWAGVGRGISAIEIVIIIAIGIAILHVAINVLASSTEQLDEIVALPELIVVERASLAKPAAAVVKGDVEVEGADHCVSNAHADHQEAKVRVGDVARRVTRVIT